MKGDTRSLDYSLGVTKKIEGCQEDREPNGKEHEA